MTDFPQGLRMARHGDEARLFALFIMAHAENGFGVMDDIVVQAAIERGCRGESIVIALIDGPERIEAVIGLHPVRPWYASEAPENYYSSELLFYVHPLHRRSRHAAKLFQFAEWWEQATKLPVVLNLLPKDKLEPKEKLFSRHAKRVGAIYQVSGHV